MTVSSPESTVPRNDRRKRHSKNVNQINESTEKKKKVVGKRIYLNKKFNKLKLVLNQKRSRPMYLS